MQLHIMNLNIQCKNGYKDENFRFVYISLISFNFSRISIFVTFYTVSFNNVQVFRGVTPKDKVIKEARNMVAKKVIYFTCQ